MIVAYLCHELLGENEVRQSDWIRGNIKSGTATSSTGNADDKYTPVCTY